MSDFLNDAKRGLERYKKQDRLFLIYVLVFWGGAAYLNDVLCYLLACIITTNWVALRKSTLDQEQAIQRLEELESQID